jgi:Asp-tRNA(Asn)/Glu-tRNA(Gln) amidotransferase A subunit family amidase
LSQARALDRVPRDQRGQLHGVAIAIKDIMDTKGELSSPAGRDVAHSIKTCQQSMVLLCTRAISQMPIAQLLRYSGGLEP